MIIQQHCQRLGPHSGTLNIPSFARSEAAATKFFPSCPVEEGGHSLRAGYYSRASFSNELTCVLIIYHHVMMSCDDQDNELDNRIILTIYCSCGYYLRAVTVSSSSAS